MKEVAVLLACVAVILLQAEHVHSKYLFNCLLPGQKCQNGGQCDWVDNRCSCEDQYTGYDCGLPVTSNCTSDLECNEGECMNDGQEDICYCTEGFFYNKETKRCEDRNKVMECNANYMTMRVVPYKSFEGSVYIHQQYSTPGCLFNETSPGVWTLRLDFKNTTCGGPARAGNKAQYVVLVQHHPDIVTHHDLATTFICNLPRRTMQVSLTATFQVKQPKSSGIILANPSSKYEHGLAVDVLTSKGDDIKGPVHVGDELLVVVQLDKTKGQYTKVWVPFIVAHNNINKYYFVDYGCVTEESIAQISGFRIEESEDKYTIIMKFHMIQFDGGSPVVFNVQTYLCDEENSYWCLPEPCYHDGQVKNIPGIITGIENGIGRRRRREVEERAREHNKMANEWRDMEGRDMMGSMMGSHWRDVEGRAPNEGEVKGRARENSMMDRAKWMTSGQIREGVHVVSANITINVFYPFHNPETDGNEVEQNLISRGGNRIEAETILISRDNGDAAAEPVLVQQSMFMMMSLLLVLVVMVCCCVRGTQQALHHRQYNLKLAAGQVQPI